MRERLYALARDAGVACEEEILPQGEVRGALDHIERCFFGAADEFTKPTDAVALYEAGSAYSECEWVASQILKLVREQGYRYREITVTARDLDSTQVRLRAYSPATASLSIMPTAATF